LDGGVALFDSVAGVEPQSETVWRQMDKYSIPRLAFVNKMDRTGADFDYVIQTLIDRLAAKPVRVQLPIGAEEGFEGVVDLVKMRALIWHGEELGATWDEVDIPENLLAAAQSARQELLDILAAHDSDAHNNDELMELVLAEEDVPPEIVTAALRRATLDIAITPVFCGSAFKNKGVQPLLDAVVSYLPSPLDAGETEGDDPKDEEKKIARSPSIDEPFCALAFKIQTDPFIGKLTYLRVYSGQLETGTKVYNASTGRQERVGRLLIMHADDREDTDSVAAGEIVAAVGLKDVTTGDTICDPEAPLILHNIDFPDPVVHVHIEPESKSDQEKLGVALARLVEEDPTLHLKTDEETGETIISGIGELQLEIVIDRLKREFKVNASIGKPQVAYRETIKKRIEKVEGKFIRQSGGRGQHGHVVINMEPAPDEGFEFTSKIKGGAIPSEYIPSVQKGIEEALNSGPKAGYPVVDLRVELVDGSYHDVDSSEMAFKIAGSKAFQNAAPLASPVLLEPMMSVEVITPEDFLGDVMGDISRRRGRVEGQELQGNALILKAKVPLAEMFGYANDLRTISQGRANYSMLFEAYEEVPANIADELAEG
jgi:elongation factor G